MSLHDCDLRGVVKTFPLENINIFNIYALFDESLGRFCQLVRAIFETPRYCTQLNFKDPSSHLRKWPVFVCETIQIFSFKLIVLSARTDHSDTNAHEGKRMQQLC